MKYQTKQMTMMHRYAHDRGMQQKVGDGLLTL
jgi:hypothetical protein